MAHTRRLLPQLIRHLDAKEFSIIVGPRQSGKTTLLKHILGQDVRYVSLDPPDVRASAAADPRGFLEMYRPPVILDEIQYVPDLLPYIKERIDADRQRTGQFFLTGSQNLLMLERVTETLAGRAAMLKLLPLSRREAWGQADLPLPWERTGADRTVARPSFGGLWESFLRGGYPELAANPGRDAGLWHSSYIRLLLLH
jgi:predicted AAA+ superfamily ATPase